MEAVEEDSPTVDEKMDYGLLSDLADIEFFVSGTFDPEELVKGVQEGLAMLDEFSVYDVVPAGDVSAETFLVSSRGEARPRGDGSIKWRFMG